MYIGDINFKQFESLSPQGAAFCSSTAHRLLYNARWVMQADVYWQHSLLGDAFLLVVARYAA